MFDGTTGPQPPSSLGWPINGAGINATGGLEQCQWNPQTGKFYQNVPVDGAGPGGAIAVINGKTMIGRDEPPGSERGLQSPPRNGHRPEPPDHARLQRTVTSWSPGTSIGILSS